MQPPAYEGAYQSYPQWCSGPHLNASACWVGGGLCTSNPNATLPSFTQTEYETCMREQQTEQCLVRPPPSASWDPCTRTACCDAQWRRVESHGLAVCSANFRFSPRYCHMFAAYDSLRHLCTYDSLKHILLAMRMS